MDSPHHTQATTLEASRSGLHADLSNRPALNPLSPLRRLSRTLDGFRARRRSMSMSEREGGLLAEYDSSSQSHEWLLKLFKNLTFLWSADDVKRDFILTLAKALLSFGAPSHRIEAHLTAAGDLLHLRAGECLSCQRVHTMINSPMADSGRIYPSPQHCHHLDALPRETGNQNILPAISGSYRIDILEAGSPNLQKRPAWELGTRVRHASAQKADEGTTDLRTWNPVLPRFSECLHHMWAVLWWLVVGYVGQRGLCVCSSIPGFKRCE